jgi:hypothetical protein
MILLCGIKEDAPLARIRDLLRDCSAETVFYDQRSVLETSIKLSSEPGGGGTFRVGVTTIELQSISAAYVRCYDVRQLPRVEKAGVESDEWNHALGVEDALVTWLETCDALVVNRPSAMTGNGSKPYQTEQIRAQGFAVPHTLLTTDPRAATEFWRAHREVIYKSISSVRSVVARLGSDHIDRLSEVTNCPTQFQELIPGQDHRVHVIGDEVYACAIGSSSVDYRYAKDKSQVTVYPCELPRSLTDRCRALAGHLGLAFAGIDLRETPRGEWYCFEVNPSPAFTFYEQMADQPLGQAVARLLQDAPFRNRSRQTLRQAALRPLANGLPGD